MKAAVLHVNTCRADSNAPTMRIARFVSQELGIPLIHDMITGHEQLTQKFDVLFVKYGVLKFSEHREFALEIYSNAKRIIDLQNDYLMVPDSRFKKANASREVWGTVPSVVEQHGGAYINWNQLTWYANAVPLPYAQRWNGLFYYGAFREGRADALRKFYGGAHPYDVVISTNGRNKKKFLALNPGAHMLPTLDVPNMRRGRMTVYMEDAASHTLYCSLANRFYECLSLGIPMVFDDACAATLETAKLPHWEKYRAGDVLHVDHMLRRADRVMGAQRDLWAKKNYLAQLKRDLRRVAVQQLGWRF